MQRFIVRYRSRQGGGIEWVSLSVRFNTKTENFCTGIVKAVEDFRREHHTSEGYDTITCRVITTNPHDKSVLLEVIEGT